jgi:type VI protein secretion system component VasF
VTDSKDPDQIRQEIEATRQELGDTVEALASKTDVKAHARERIERTKASLPDPPIVLGVVGVVVVGFVGWRLIRR